MTPITERTFEYTTSTTARSSTFGGTPSRVLSQVDEDTGGLAWHEQYAAEQDQDEEEEELVHRGVAEEEADGRADNECVAPPWNCDEN
jgi:hypothetical protein